MCTLSYSSYQDLLVQVQSVCGSTCTITLCGILPRSANLYQDEAWNEKRMPQILDSGKKLDKTLRELADRKDLRFMDCCLFVPKQHLGRDGLHLNRSGAHLLRDSLSSCIAESRLQQPVQVSTDLTDAKEGDLSCKLTYAEVLALPSKGSTAKVCSVNSLRHTIDSTCENFPLAHSVSARRHLLIVKKLLSYVVAILKIFFFINNNECHLSFSFKVSFPW